MKKLKNGKVLKYENPTYNNKKGEMAKFWIKKRKNITSLTMGIIFILIGMSWTSISLLSLGFKSGWNIPPLLFFTVGIILAYLGASEKWH